MNLSMSLFSNVENLEINNIILAFISLLLIEYA